MQGNCTLTQAATERCNPSLRAELPKTCMPSSCTSASSWASVALQKALCFLTKLGSNCDCSEKQLQESNCLELGSPCQLRIIESAFKEPAVPKSSYNPASPLSPATDTSSVWWAHLTRRVKDPSSKPLSRSVTQVAIQQLIFPIWAQTRAQAGHSSGGRSECSSKQRQKRRLKSALLYTTNCSSILGEVMEIMLWLCHLQCERPLLPLLQNRFTSSSLAAMRIFWNNSMPVVLGWSERGFSLDYTPVWRKKRGFLLQKRFIDTHIGTYIWSLSEITVQLFS